MRPNIETFIGCDSTYEDADIVLFGAPFDSTTSFRPGARFGSAAMRHESFGLETYSPYQDRDLTNCHVFDSGDLELCFGDAKTALRDIEQHAAQILSDNKLPLLIGGEHLVTLGALWAVHKKYPDLHIIHFDAHADLRDDYLGAHLSHACVMRRAYELLHAPESAAAESTNCVPGSPSCALESANCSSESASCAPDSRRIHQFCIRSGDRTEFVFAKNHTDIHPFTFHGLDTLVEQLKASHIPVYLTIDLDCLDPAAFPGTGTPEAGGITFLQLLDAIQCVCKANVVAADVNELAPMLDVSGVSTATACKVLRELILALSTKYCED